LYDAVGNVSLYFVYYSGLGRSVVQTTHNSKGDTIKQSVNNYSEAVSNNYAFFSRYDYDNTGRMSQVSTSLADNKSAVSINQLCRNYNFSQAIKGIKRII
jgi:hypothetical protein